MDNLEKGKKISMLRLETTIKRPKGRTYVHISVDNVDNVDLKFKN